MVISSVSQISRNSGVTDMENFTDGMGQALRPPESASQSKRSQRQTRLMVGDRIEAAMESSDRRAAPPRAGRAANAAVGSLGRDE